MLQIQKGNPPWVEFKTISVEDHAKTQETGAKAFKDVDMALIYPAGSKDCVEKVAVEWLEQIKRQAANGLYDEGWARDFALHYKRWKEGQEEILAGTPLVVLKGVGPSQIEQCKIARIHTVEALAQANEGQISLMGMGGRALKQQAMDYIQSTSGSKEAIESLKAQLAEKDAAIADLQAKNTAKDAMLASFESRLALLEAAKPKRGRPKKVEA